jgi:hypothetical protein
MEIELTLERITDDNPPCYVWGSASKGVKLYVWKDDLIPALSMNDGLTTVTWNRPPTPEEIKQDGGIRVALEYPTKL